jgi:thioredoxin reductase
VRTAKSEFIARRVLLSIGRRGSPRKLGVPGEKTGKVFYRPLDPEKFHDLDILVVGGGDSAVEAAVALADQPGNSVFLSYRREAIFRIKAGNEKRLENAVREGRITPLFKSEVTRIEGNTVYLTQDGLELCLSNDYVFVFAGGELPSDLLRRVGIEFTRKFGQA